MFLTSLTMRGFKSFADPTRLDAEPGITVVVGPNGSGKSNVVDALAWVLGTTSARKVRGGAMADVIFAGSPTRAGAGAARVEITIDNSQGQLGHAGLGSARSAQEYRDVRVARTIHANGESLYEINGQEVRALDVQELLSDTGLGRELHTIVGQGQLDEILSARPEERRRYLEEAAGISKHRRRRERAARKLAQVEEHSERLQAVLAELRRQLRPLHRQAQAATRQRDLAAELRTVRLRLGAHDLAHHQRQVAAARAADTAADHHHRTATAAVEELRQTQAVAEVAMADLQPRAHAATDTFHRLSSLRVRLEGTGDLVDAKRRYLLDAVEESLAGRPPEELRAQADRLAARADALGRDWAAAQQALEHAVAIRRDAEAARKAHAAARHAEQRRRAEQRERYLRWEGEVSALRGSIAAAEAEAGRVTSQVQGLDARLAETAAETNRVEQSLRGLDEAEVALTEALEGAEGAVTVARSRVEELDQRRSDLERDQAAAAARAEALRAALRERSGGHHALLEGGVKGILGPVAAMLALQPEHDHAVAAALGDLGEAIVAASRGHGAAAVAWLRDAGAGRAGVLPADAPPPAGGGAAAASPADSAGHRLPAGARPVADLIRPADDREHAVATVAVLHRLVADHYLVPDWDTATRAQRAAPGCTFVTPAGDVAGPRGYAGGAADQRSAVATSAAADEAAARAQRRARELDDLASDLADARSGLEQAQADHAAAATRINESDARIAGAAERLARLTREHQSLTDQRTIVAAQKQELASVLARDRAALSELHGRGPDDEPVADEGPDPVADRLDADVEAAASDELDSRIRAERVGEQQRQVAAQAIDLRAEAGEVEHALAEAARRRERRRGAIARCGDLAEVARLAAEAAARAVTAAGHERDAATSRVRAHEEQLARLRRRGEELVGEVAAAAEARQHAALQRANAEQRLTAVEERVRADFGLDPDAVVAEHADEATDRPALAEREETLARKLAQLGRVNPLALEEFHAVEQRHAFLAAQLDDLRRARHDLVEVIEAVDDGMRDVLGAAFRDIATSFEQLFAAMFPGGHGRLLLTGSDDPLNAGIDVEARPAGKKVTRLSLLSGGERSLTVLAFVFAIFRARPSPFYVLDEVDAALDDVNLERLLSVIETFRGDAQVVMVTHQQRSMEIADLLYGVTMGPDGVTTVVAERLGDAVQHELPRPVGTEPARL